MPRRKRCRTIQGPPCCTEFKPKGIPSRYMDTVELALDEFESIRLADHEQLEHSEAAGRMGVSRSVFTRLLQAARNKVAQALVQGKELAIGGGEYHFEEILFRCLQCYALFSSKIDEQSPEQCPECGSGNINNLNHNFGMRGRCRRHALD